MEGDLRRNTLLIGSKNQRIKSKTGKERTTEGRVMRNWEEPQGFKGAKYIAKDGVEQSGPTDFAAPEVENARVPRDAQKVRSNCERWSETAWRDRLYNSEVERDVFAVQNLNNGLRDDLESRSVWLVNEKHSKQWSHFGSEGMVYRVTYGGRRLVLGKRKKRAVGFGMVPMCCPDVKMGPAEANCRSTFIKHPALPQ